MHSAATQDDDKLSEPSLEASYLKIKEQGPDSPWVQHKSHRNVQPVNLHYQQTVETFLAHGLDLSAQNNQVISF